MADLTKAKVDPMVPRVRGFGQSSPPCRSTSRNWPDLKSIEEEKYATISGHRCSSSNCPRASSDTYGMHTFTGPIVAVASGKMKARQPSNDCSGHRRTETASHRRWRPLRFHTPCAATSTFTYIVMDKPDLWPHHRTRPPPTRRIGLKTKEHALRQRQTRRVNPNLPRPRRRLTTFVRRVGFSADQKPPHGKLLTRAIPHKRLLLHRDVS